MEKDIPITISLKDRLLKAKYKAFVMGIINCTPNSFYENNRTQNTENALELALKMIDEGVDIIDLGGESTKPGSEYVSTQEELNRVIPVIKEIRKHSDCPISIDTRKKEVFEQAFDNGADILNDISSLEDDELMVKYIAKKKVPVILMHKRGTPINMQKNTDYTDIYKEVSTFLYERAIFAIENGIEPEKIIFDPGIGFGKDTKDNICLIRKCGLLSHLITDKTGKTNNVIMALSRKTCIGEITQQKVEDRLAGTLAANILSIQNGATIVRVHDVKETIDALKIMQEIG